ncbi:MAG: dTDP-4-dehydrorhamnose reductase [Sedimentisphaerales bacterium]|nr:dTDP-4-dehydrorhamnose reductase [Sedimentisphaerales bacterium]
MQAIVTGSQGMLGKELKAILSSNNIPALYTDINPGENEFRLDITDREAVIAKVEELKPRVIFNCSAYTNVDLAEEQEDIAARINGYGVENLAIAAKANDVLLVHISRDYVFSGNNDKPYLPGDITGPQGAYGRTKLLGEQLIISSGCRYQIIRTAWLFGPQGKNFVETIFKLSQSRSELKVVNDQHGCPTWAPDLAQCMADIATKPEYGIFHFCNGPACTWFDLARAVVQDAGHDCTVKPCNSTEFPRPAQRPAWSVLGSSETYRIIGWQPRKWQDAVTQYVKALKS